MKYIHRKIQGYKDFDIFAKAHDNGRNILLKGPTGSAKTMVGSSYSKENSYPLAVVPCSHATDPGSLFGRYTPKEGEDFFEWTDGVITELVRKPGKKVLILDEVNMADPKIMASLFSLLDSNKTLNLIDHNEVIKVEDLLVIATMNPGYRGTRDLNKALANRFAYTFYWDYDTHVESSICPSPSFLKCVTKIRESGDSDTPFSTNMIIEFIEANKEFNFEFALEMIGNKYDRDESQGVMQVFKQNKTDIIRELSRKKDSQGRAKPIRGSHNYNWSGIDT